MIKPTIMGPNKPLYGIGIHDEKHVDITSLSACPRYDPGNSG